jgi:uncharacterized coiled-coil protein SlyX
MHITIKSLANRVEQIENRVSGMEDKVEELDHTVNNLERMQRKHECNMEDIWHNTKSANL